MVIQMKQVYLLEGKDSMTIVSEKEKHFKFLGKPLASLNEISGLIPKDQLFLLEQYGAWMEALVKNKIRPLTEDQKQFIQVAIGGRCGKTSFEKAWINSVIVKNRNRTDLITRETQPSARVSNVSSFSNSKTMYSGHSNSGGGIGFITGIVLAVLAFSIVPVIPVIIAFIAGHWLSYNFGKK